MKKTTKLRYPLEVFWSDEDAGYIATAPDLPGCSAWGKTETEALTEAHHAIAAWLEAAKSAGHLIPQPTIPSGKECSGRFVMRVPKRLHTDLARTAKREGVSLNQYLLYLLAARYAAENNKRTT